MGYDAMANCASANASIPRDISKKKKVGESDYSASHYEDVFDLSLDLIDSLFMFLGQSLGETEAM